MNNLFEPSKVEEVKGRLARLRPDSERLWGKMNPAQTLAHCSLAIGIAEEKLTPPRILLGRLLGPVPKNAVITKGAPVRRNALTVKSFVVAYDRDFGAERRQVLEAIDHFAAGGAAGCSTHRHFFF